MCLQIVVRVCISHAFGVQVGTTHAVPVEGTDNEGWQDADQVAEQDGTHLAH